MAPRRQAGPGGGEARAKIDTTAPFFRSKLRPPQPSERSIRRPRLERLLDDLTRLPVTLVLAPAGAGKTALAAEWARHADVPTAWVTLDESDAEPVTLWTVLVTALDHIEPGCRARIMPLLRTSKLDEALRALEEVFEESGGAPRVLVVDNLHHLERDASAGLSFRQFVEHLPEELHLLLLSRRPPDLSIDGMRGAGRLAEVGYSELSFSYGESVAVLRQLSPQMTQQQVATVARRADGWAAALQLSALAARAERATPLTEDHPRSAERMVDEYVWREVLRAEPARIVQVLVECSVVNRVNGSLAESLTGRPDAGSLLAEAERRCLFVTQLEGGWFQVHDLVRDMLHAELAKRPDGRLAEQHVRAARWFEDIGEAATAVDHWLSGGRPDEALRLLATSTTELYDAGGASVILRLMKRIPPAVAGKDVRSMQNFALCQLLVSQQDFLDTVGALEAYEQLTPDVAPEGRGQTMILQLMARLMTGEWEDGEDRALEAFQTIGTGAILDPFGRFTWNLAARSIALTERWDDHAPDVLRTKAGLVTDPERRLAWEGTRALGLALSGQSVDALRVAAGAARTANTSNLTVLRAEVELAEALALAELGDQPRARMKLAGLAGLESQPVSYVQVLATLALVEDLLRGGEVDEAERELVRAEALVRERTPGPGGRTALGRVAVLVALAANDPKRAQGWCDRLPDPFWSAISQARIRLAAGDRAGARDALDVAAPRCPRHEVVRGLLRAVATDNRDAAQKQVADAIERASDAGLLDTVAAEGYEVRELIELAAWRVPQQWLERLRRQVRPLVAERVPTSVPQEALTPRELEVLRLLPSRLTLREIAGELFVSQNTLKFHLRLIYRKLGVNSRSDAVEAARQLRLHP